MTTPPNYNYSVTVNGSAFTITPEGDAPESRKGTVLTQPLLHLHQKPQQPWYFSKYPMTPRRPNLGNSRCRQKYCDHRFRR